MNAIKPIATNSRKTLFHEVSVSMVIVQVAGPEGKVIEGHLMPDHVHMLVSIPPKIGASGFMGCLKGRSSPRMFDRLATSQGAIGPERRFRPGT